MRFHKLQLNNGGINIFFIIRGQDIILSIHFFTGSRHGRPRREALLRLEDGIEKMHLVETAPREHGDRFLTCIRPPGRDPDIYFRGKTFSLGFSTVVLCDRSMRCPSTRVRWAKKTHVITNIHSTMEMNKMHRWQAPKSNLQF